MPWHVVFTTLDGVVGPFDRAILCHMYGGIQAAAPPSGGAEWFFQNIILRHRRES